MTLCLPVFSLESMRRLDEFLSGVSSLWCTAVVPRVTGAAVPATQAPARGTLGGPRGGTGSPWNVRPTLNSVTRCASPGRPGGGRAELVVPKSHAAPGLCLRALPPPASRLVQPGGWGAVRGRMPQPASAATQDAEPASLGPLPATLCASCAV